MWGVATSTDGVHFDLVNLTAHNSQTDTPGGSVDGNALLIDDDGTGYIAFATVGRGGTRPGDHMVTIERLAPSLTASTQQMVAPFFPDTFVEGVQFFKRASLYYLIYSYVRVRVVPDSGALSRSPGYQASVSSLPLDRNIIHTLSGAPLLERRLLIAC